MGVEYVQTVAWPGVKSCLSCQYVCSHGITPGKAILTTAPQGDAPREFGDLKFSDGRGQVKIPNCKVDQMTPQMGPNGTTFTLEILDERWRWKFGAISGNYNKTDTRGKLVPWTIRSPRELAILCLRAMGVRSYTINLPAGLESSAGKDYQRYLKLGENFPQSLTNPEMTWDHIPPAEALAALADLFACRVIYQPNRAHVLIGQLGGGAKFPNFPYESAGLTIDGPEAPAYVGVFGAPVKYQSRFALEAVGEEWDGSYLPIADLSYAPEVPEAGVGKQKVEILAVDDVQTGRGGFVVVYKGDESKPVAVVEVPKTGDLTSRFTAVVAGLNAIAAFRALATASLVGGLLFIEGEGFSVELFSDARTVSDWLTFRVVNDGPTKENPWRNSNPPLFTTVRATNRLSYSEARGLAQRSVFKCYRIRNVDVADRFKAKDPGPLLIPAYGKVVRRQQIVLLNSKVEQVAPAPRIPGAINRDAPPDPQNAFGVLPEFYNGYSRDKANTVTGSVHHRISSVNWLFVTNKDNTRMNTDPKDNIFVGFSINAVEQLVVFGEPVYEFEDGGFFKPAKLILEAGHYVLDAITDAPKRWEEILRVPDGTAPVEWAHREDIQVGVIGEYGSGGDKLVNFRYADVADARSRAGYYLRGMASKYKVVGGETRQYIGIIPHDPDGFCQQTTWMVGDGGPTTIVSGNTEHSPTIPPYPARRRAENLSPEASAAVANMRERALYFPTKPDRGEIRLEDV